MPKNAKITDRVRFLLESVNRGVVHVRRRDTRQEDWHIVQAHRYMDQKRRQPSFPEITKLKTAGFIDYVVDPGNCTIYADGRREEHHRATLTDAGKEALACTTK